MLVALSAVALCVPASGAGKASGLPSKIGKGEGKLTMIAWEGYLDAKWVKPFVKQTGCKVQAKYAGTSDEMVTLMRTGGGGQYDMVSASGDASLRLIYGKDVQPVNTNLVPSWKQFFKAFQSPPNNTVGGQHYGISLQWGPNTLLYNTKKVKPAPTSWSAISLYLSKTQPSLGIKDPYELNQKQFNAAIALIKRQKPLIKKYWGLSSDEVSLFKNGDAWIGASWPVTTGSIQAAKVPVKEIIPKEGATGWLDTWMLSSKAKHPNCAYKWYGYISSPKVQALQATTYGETPVNKLACVEMNKLSKGSCHTYHADAPESYYRSIKFWKTPVADCGNGQKNCMDYRKWVNAWNQAVS
ncbi:MAG: ABC transporter substrate-binding protein [Actinobacteria bacterium]|nr:MAG: ABC transporter substrate-binding protein [Actinomycetota bacterium]